MDLLNQLKELERDVFTQGLRNKVVKEEDSLMSKIIKAGKQKELPSATIIEIPVKEVLVQIDRP